MHDYPAILIVDDNHLVRQILARRLRDEDFTPYVASTGIEGFRRLIDLADELALVLLDISMEGLDGFQFRSRQLETPKLAAVPTIVVSGRIPNDEDRSIMQAAEWLTKPTPPERLLAAIRTHARHRDGSLI